MSRLSGIIVIFISFLVVSPAISFTADQEYYHAHKIRSDIRYPGFYTILKSTVIDSHRFAVFSRGEEYKDGYHKNYGIFGFASTDVGKSTKPGVFFKGIGGSWAANDLDAVWPGDLQQTRKKHGLLFAAMTGDYDDSLPYFAVARFNNKGRPVGDPEIIYEVVDVTGTSTWLWDSWIAATIGPESIGVAFSYVFRDLNLGRTSDYRSRAFFAEFDFEGNQIGKLKEFKFPPPGNGNSHTFRVFAPGNLAGSWLVPASAKIIQDASQLTVHEQLFISVVKDKDPIQARVIERTNHVMDVKKDFVYSSLQFLPPDNKTGVAAKETLTLFAQQRNFNPAEKPEVKEYDSEYYLYTINKKGRQAAKAKKLNAPQWIPEIEQKGRLLTRFNEIVSRLQPIADGRFMFVITRDLELTTRDKYQFSESEGDMFVGVLEANKKKITVPMSDLFADYNYFRISDSAREDLLSFGKNKRLGFIEECGGEGYNASKKNWFNAILFDPADEPTSPPARADHAMVYNSDTGMTLLFGGANGGKYYRDLWQWDGSRWHLLDAGTGPSPRSKHAMAYDQKNGNVVLLGGRKGFRALRDTWIWDGIKWQRMHPDFEPQHREGHAMVYDPMSKTVILYGGRYIPNYFSTLWSWNGTTWKKISEKNPPGWRVEHCMAWDGKRNGIVLYGGFNSSELKNDTWLLQGSTWTRLSEGGQWVNPDQRSGAAMAWFPEQDSIFLFGGVRDNGNTDNNCYALPSAESTWSNKWPPTWITGRAGHAMVYDEKRGHILMFGGWNAGKVNSQTWIWDGEDWFNVMP